MKQIAALIKKRDFILKNGVSRKLISDVEKEFGNIVLSEILMISMYTKALTNTNLDITISKLDAEIQRLKSNVKEIQINDIMTIDTSVLNFIEEIKTFRERFDVISLDHIKLENLKKQDSYYPYYNNEKELVFLSDVRIDELVKESSYINTLDTDIQDLIKTIDSLDFKTSDEFVYLRDVFKYISKIDAHVTDLEKITMTLQEIIVKAIFKTPEELKKYYNRYNKYYTLSTQEVNLILIKIALLLFKK